MRTCLGNNGDRSMKTIEFNQENFDNLVVLNSEMLGALRGIVNGCCHPDIAVRAVFVDLAPIRKAIKKSEELTFQETQVQ